MQCNHFLRFLFSNSIIAGNMYNNSSMIPRLKKPGPGWSTSHCPKNIHLQGQQLQQFHSTQFRLVGRVSQRARNSLSACKVSPACLQATSCTGISIIPSYKMLWWCFSISINLSKHLALFPTLKS